MYTSYQLNVILDLNNLDYSIPGICHYIKFLHEGTGVKPDTKVRSSVAVCLGKNIGNLRNLSSVTTIYVRQLRVLYNLTIIVFHW